MPGMDRNDRYRRPLEVVVETRPRRRVNVSRVGRAVLLTALDTVATFLPPPLSFIVKVFLNLL